MARPAEKARAMLNKWVALREQEGVGGSKKSSGGRPGSGRRPYLASECEFLADAERFRGQIVREISEGIAKIQNPALGEHEIRELNDDINHKMREKWHWNRRIIELGGVDYNKLERQRQLEQEGTATSAIGGNSSSSSVQGASTSGGRYKYYGAARELPGVKEMLAKEEETRLRQLHQKKSLKELYSGITPDYFGWRDEEGGSLLELEALATKQNDQKVHNKKRKKPNKSTSDETEDKHVDYLNVPNQETVSRILLECRKKAMLEKYNL